MKPRTVVLFFSVIIVFVSGFLLHYGAHRPLNSTRLEMEVLKKKLSKQAARGTKDDPDARARYDWLRLHDPKTGKIPEGIRGRELAYSAKLPRAESMSTSTAFAKGQSLTWTRRGPYNVGGRTRALGIDVANPNIIVAGGVSGGLWRSTDDGTSWVKTTAPDQLHSVSCLVQDTRPGQTSTWYAGTGELLGNSASGGGASYRGDGIFKSTDNGASWSLLPSTSTNQPHLFDNIFNYVWSLAIDPSNTAQSEVYAATYGAIQRSTDGGANWSVVLGGSSPYSFFTDVKVTSGGVVYAALSKSAGTEASAGIKRSTDGITWTDITPTFGFPSLYSRIVLAIAPSNENIVYFLLQQSDTTTNASQVRGHQLWKYTYVSGNGTPASGGGTWENRGGNLPLETGLGGNARFDTQGGYDMFLAVKPDDPNFLVLGGVNLYASTDAFASSTTWKRIGGYASPTTYGSYSNHHADQHSGMFRPGSSTIFYSGHDGGISKTTNITSTSVTWSTLNRGYYTTQFYTIALDRSTSGSDVVIGGMQDNGTWLTRNTNTTLPWIDIFGGDGAYCAIADGESHYYVSSQNGNVYRLQLDTFGNWLSWANVQPTGGSGYLFINPFILDPNNTKRMYLAGGGTIWRNDDLTAIPNFNQQTTSINWTQFAQPSGFSGIISALGVSSTPPNRLYYGTSTGTVYRVDNAHQGSPTAVSISAGSGFPTGFVSSIAVDPTDGDRVMVVFSNYQVASLFFTTNGGTSWADVGGNLEEFPGGAGNGPSCRWATIVPFGGATYYFVATSTGLYSTTTLNGQNTVWGLEGADVIGNVVVDMIDARRSDGKIVVGTHATGVFSAMLGGAVSPPSAPTLVSPDDGATGVSTSPTFTWNPSAGATAYSLQVATDALFINTVVSQAGITSTSYTVTGLFGNTTYYWRVGASNAGGSSPYSATRSFTTAGTTGTTTVAVRYFNPASQQRVYTVDRALPIDSGFVFGTNRYVDLGKGTAFVLPNNAQTGTVSEVKVWFGYKRSGLTTQTYRIRIYNGTANSGPIGSPLHSQEYLMSGVLADDNFQTTEQATVHTLSQAVPVGASFFVVVDFGSYGPADYGNLGIVSTEYLGRRVREEWEQWQDGNWHNVSDAWTQGADGWNMWVEVTATIPTATSTEPVAGIPTSYELMQNYPNPFNPSTIIKYSLPAFAHVKLQIIDVAGREIMRLVDQHQPAGSYEVTWDGRTAGGHAASSGVYFYRLESGPYRAMKKMVLLK